MTRYFSDIVTPDGRPQAGIFIAARDPATTTIAGKAGYDFVVIDREHGPLDVGITMLHIQAALGVGIVPIVRVLENSSALIQQTLDLGALGVMVPRVGTVEDAQRAVAAARYERGGRGACPAVAASDWTGEGWAGHVDASNQGIAVIPLIETEEGIKNAGEIAAVPGIDHLFFGPADLAQDMGIDMVGDSARLVEIWHDFAAEVRGAGALPGAPFGMQFDEGNAFGACGVDLMLFRKALEQARPQL